MSVHGHGIFYKDKGNHKIQQIEEIKKNKKKMSNHWL